MGEEKGIVTRADADNSDRNESRRGKGGILGWLRARRRHPVPLEPTEEVKLTIARAILEFIRRAKESPNVLNEPSIWNIASSSDARLGDTPFADGSELAHIWEVADNYCDAISEPQAYRGHEADVDGWGRELVRWAADVLEPPERAPESGRVEDECE